MRKFGCLGTTLIALAVLALVISGPGDDQATANPPGLAAHAPIPDAYRQLINTAAAHCTQTSAPLLAAQIDTESNWSPRAVSPQGAQGLAQFTPDTWERWGRDTDGNGHASPFDPADAIDAQARYLCHLADDLADLPGSPVDNTLAAYNAGPAAVRTHNGPPPFPETQTYIRRVKERIPRYQTALSTHTGTARDCTFTLTRQNPRTCHQAIEAARREAHSASLAWHRRCLAFTAQAYGWSASGEATANVAWDRALATGTAHPHDTNPPAGALLFYDNGDTAGHVALHLGDDQAATNDIATPGRIDIVPLNDLTDGRWNLTYLGWAPPDFPHATGSTSDVG
ncbi:lytic transglycosylase domain-containing protein [Streptomyces johnsoniae]|uniref:Lytic transglycosylase domain-containing protein n=1 Tax=Streptomyces johnsoniae TaxID=3075532 RepID=A0ABU2SD54_9ACTN|nr:lytic transglycosylase domain-containing protein [Streptomyces sp. DSM 41886]MDT0446827.1 lytic transglycosylase domain-containing protein [Streptomyces sp. DSM 41886]